MIMKKIVTRDSFQAMLDKPDYKYVTKVVGRALVRIYERQTAEEQMRGDTVVNNGVGFTGADGRYGTWCAELYAREGRLARKTVEKWLKKGKTGYSRIAKYHAQLNEVANQVAIVNKWEENG